MPLLARKFVNAAGLFWDSLDEHERSLVLYGAAYLVANLALLYLNASARSRRDLVTEIVRRELDASEAR